MTQKQNYWSDLIIFFFSNVHNFWGDTYLQSEANRFYSMVKNRANEKNVTRKAFLRLTPQKRPQIPNTGVFLCWRLTSISDSAPWMELRIVADLENRFSGDDEALGLTCAHQMKGSMNNHLAASLNKPTDLIGPWMRRWSILILIVCAAVLDILF